MNSPASPILLALFSLAPFLSAAADPTDIGERRELFLDDRLIERLDGSARLTLHEPRDEGIAFKFDNPWEGQFCGYATIIKDGDLYRAYYRGLPVARADGSSEECTCYAESPDGKVWTKPKLGLYDLHGTRDNNAVLAEAAPVTHNFSPMLDTRPGVPAEERFKALGGVMKSGLIAWVSADGKQWRRLREDPVIPPSLVKFPYFFDSQNLAFWSDAEKKYVCFFRVFQDKIRRIARTTSNDFLTWSEPVLMEYRHRGGEAPIEHLYTNQTHPYFRAPHLYLSVAARFMPGRKVLTEEQAMEIGVNPGYFKDTSDAIIMSTRPGERHYERTFLSSFVRPGIGARNWVSRTNYPALNVVPTGETEMSLYLNQDYAQPTAHLRRYSLRLDGFASVKTDHEGGELLTKPLSFSGARLGVNFSTSAAGGLRVEIQDATTGGPIPGFALDDCVEQIGNEIDRTVAWNGGGDVSALVGKPVRLRLALRDADLFSYRFGK